MPSYYIYPATEKQRDPEGMAPRVRAWSDQYELSENFFGLMGGVATSIFDDYPPVFAQICAIARVDFDEVLPLYVSSHTAAFDDLEAFERYFDAEVLRVRKELTLVRGKFTELYESLKSQPGWESKLVYSSKYGPEPEYFADFPAQQHHKSKEEFDVWEDFDEPENIRFSFGHDLRAMLEFMEFAEAFGSRWIWLVGR